MKRITALLLAAVLTLGLFPLAGCGESEPVTSEEPEASASPSPTAKPSPTPTPTPSPSPTATPSEEPSNLDPLTGLEMAEDASAGDRPVAVMINNIKQALPQYGTGAADILFEVVAEGGITRLVAIYQDPTAAGTIGSVRSTRKYYLDIAGSYDAILFHAGGSEEAYSLIKSRQQASVDNVRGGGNPGDTFYLDADRRRNNGYEHSTMTTGERIDAYLDRTSLRTEHPEDYKFEQAFSEDRKGSGEATDYARVFFSNYKQAVLEYDGGEEKYLVSQYGAPHVDEDTGEQLAFENVLVLYASISAIPGDTAGRMTVKLENGSGGGLLLAGGAREKISWSKGAWNEPFEFEDADGEPLTLRTGRTYVCVVAGEDRVSFDK